MHCSASSSQMVSGNIPGLESHFVVYGQSFAGFHKERERLIIFIGIEGSE